MKRYDEIVRVENKKSGLSQSTRGWTIQEMEYYLMNPSKYDIYVQCRDCNNIHKIGVACQVCDKDTKVKPEVREIMKDVTLSSEVLKR